MKVRVLLVCLVALGLSASFAIAAPPPGKGKPASPGNSATAGKPQVTGPTCKPKVTVVLKGTLTGVSGNTLTMTVARGNRWARAWVTAGIASVAVDPSTTKVRRNGAKTLTDLKPTDWLLVQARACKADLMAETPPTLAAVRIVAHPAKA